MKIILNHKSSTQGSIMVEMAVALPVFALFLFGIIQYSLIFYTYITLRNSAVSSARYAVLQTPQPSDSQVQTFAQAAVGAVISSTPLQTPVVQSVTINGVSGARSVTLTYDLPLLIPYAVPGASGGIYPLTVTSVMY